MKVEGGRMTIRHTGIALLLTGLLVVVAACGDDAASVGPTLVVAASTTGALAGLRRRDGEVQWTLRLGEPVMSAPVLANGWLYVTTTRGRVFGVDLRDASSPNAPAD